MLCSTVLEFKLKEKFSFEKVLEIFKTEQATYFPHQVFDNYTGGATVFSNVQETNKIVTLSDISSIFLNRYLAQRQIIVFVDRSILFDQSKRYELCSKLVYYSLINPLVYKENQQVMQTKITLVNIQRQNPFSSMNTYFTYYYDNLEPFYKIYGGYNPDSLSVFYDKTQENYYNLYLDKLSKALNIAKDSLAKYQNEDGSFTLDEKFTQQVTDTLIVMNYETKVKSIPTIKFEDVEPIQYLSISSMGSETVSITSIQNGMLDSRSEDMFWKKMHYVFSR